LFELIVQYQCSADADAHMERASRAEEVLNDCLGWSGLGHCDGSDVSGDALNVYCYVVDPKLATATVVEELRANDLLEDAVIAFQDRDETFVVTWPENYSGVFEY
jgi:hypothetical protein